MAETDKRKCYEFHFKEAAVKYVSIILPKRGFYLRAAFINFFSSKIAASIRARLLLEGGFYSRKYGIDQLAEVFLKLSIKTRKCIQLFARLSGAAFSQAE